MVQPTVVTALNLEICFLQQHCSLFSELRCARRGIVVQGSGKAAEIMDGFRRCRQAHRRCFARFPMGRNDDNSFRPRDEWQFDGPEGAVSVKTTPRIHTNSGDTCRAAALQHQGIIFQPSFLVADDLYTGDLVEIMPAYKSIELGIYAVYTSRKQLPLKLRHLIDFLAESFHKPAWTK